MELFINKISKHSQVLMSLSVVCFISALCYSLSDYMDYKVVAFILLLTVSIAAVLFDIIPGIHNCHIQRLDLGLFFYSSPFYVTGWLYRGFHFVIDVFCYCTGKCSAHL